MVWCLMAQAITLTYVDKDPWLHLALVGYNKFEIVGQTPLIMMIIHNLVQVILANEKCTERLCQ